MRQGRFGSALAIVLLAGCGGGGGGGGAGGSPAPLTPGQIDDGIAGLPVADPATLPTTGRAEYNGYIRAGLPTGPEGARVEYLADLRLDVNFAAAFDQIRGEATGFEARDEVPLSGTLAVTGGNIYGDTDPTAAYSFNGNVDGTLTRGADSYVIDASLEGEFLGRGETAARGLVFGDVTGPLGQEIFDGTFAATRRPD